MFEHSRNGDSEAARWVADSDSVLCQAIYGRIPKLNEGSTLALDGVCRDLWLERLVSRSERIQHIAMQVKRTFQTRKKSLPMIY